MKKLKSYFSTDSLRIQLLSRSLLILAVLLALVGALQYLYMRDVVFNNKADALRSQVRTLPPPVLNSPDFVLEPDDRMGPKRFFSPEASLVFIDENGKEFFRHTGFFSKEEILAKFKEHGMDLSK